MVCALLFSIAVPTIGYLSFGIRIALLFLIGYIDGFILWIAVPIKVPFASVIIPCCVTFGIFLLHTVEENVFGLQQELSKLTGLPVPETTSFRIIFLRLAAVGAWLLCLQSAALCLATTWFGCFSLGWELPSLHSSLFRLLQQARQSISRVWLAWFSLHSLHGLIYGDFHTQMWSTACLGRRISHELAVTSR